MIRWWRLNGCNVEARPGDLAGAKRLAERNLVHKTAPRSIDKNRSALHQFEFGRRDHVVSLRRQGRMQRDDVASSQHVLEWCIEWTHAGHALVGREQRAHSEGSPNIGNRAAERAVPDDS